MNESEITNVPSPPLTQVPGLLSHNLGTQFNAQNNQDKIIQNHYGIETAAASTAKRQKTEERRISVKRNTQTKTNINTSESKPTTSHSTAPPPQNGIPLSNRFTPLQYDPANIRSIIDHDSSIDDEMEMDEYSGRQGDHAISNSESEDNNRDNSRKITTGTQFNTQTLHPQKAERVPPITIFGVPTYRAMLDLVRRSTTERVTLSSTKDSFRVKAEDMKTYKILETTFREQDIQFYTFPSAENRLKKVVLRGLSATVEIDDIKEDLLNQGFEFTDVKQLFHRPVDGVRRPMPLFVISSAAVGPENGKSISSIERVCHHRITVEKYRGPQGPRQCYNCQMYGHSSAFCHLPPTCFKCALTHASSSCPKSPTVPATCANCGGDHPASSRRCPAYQKARDHHTEPCTIQSGRRLSKKATNPRHISEATSVYARPGISYATATASPGYSQQFPPIHQQQQHQPQQPPPPTPLQRRPTIQHQQHPPSFTPSSQSSSPNATISPKIWQIILGIVETIKELNASPVLNTLANMLIEIAHVSQYGP